jgi:DNA-binding MarR family transcriptional regulator
VWRSLGSGTETGSAPAGGETEPASVPTKALDEADTGYQAGLAATQIDDDVHAEIGRQFGLFLRRADRFYADLRLGPDGLDLDRSAYLLLGRIVAAGPTRLSALAEGMCLDLSTISRQVHALEVAGLVGRTTESADRRASLIAATERGHAIYDRNRTVWLAAMRDLLADWTDAERNEFAHLLTRFNDTIATQHPAAHTAPRPAGTRRENLS